MTGELGIIRAFAGSPVEMCAYPSANKVDDEYSAGITLTRNETDVAVLYFNEHGIMLRDTVAAQSNKVAYATPPQVFDLPLAEGWTAHRASKYFKTQENVVTVYFQVHTDSPASGEVAIATLPAGFRPQATIGGTGYFKPEGGKYTPSDMKIYSDGRITGYNDVGSAEYYTGFFTFVAS